MSKRTSTPTIPQSKQPHVALLVETSLASGRDIVRGVARYARENGPWSIFYEPRSLESALPQWLAAWRGHGIIARLLNHRIAGTIAATGLPAVDVLGVSAHPQVPLVHVNDAAIAQLAAEHLLERGFRNFGFCGLPGINWSEARETAFLEAVSPHAHFTNVFKLRSAKDAHTSWESQQDALAKWVQGLPKPAAVMACNDPQGQRVIEACRRAGVSVPEQVAVIGVDNDEPICEIADPPLTSVNADHFRVGYEAAAVLARLMRGNTLSDRVVYLPPAGIVTRRSTDVLAIDDAEVAALVRYIRDHACDGISVASVLQHSALSRRTLHRRFHEVLGRSVHDEIVRVRMSRAVELLSTTDLPLPLVAERSGFRHQEYLGVVFKAQMGMTPGTYRRRALS
jgi:LacI family transcriptional regulator